MIDDIELWLGILQLFFCSSQATCFFSLGKCNSIVSWSIRLSVPAVTVGWSSNVSGLLFLPCSCWRSCPASPPSNWLAVLGEDGWHVKEQTGTAETEPLIFVLFSSTLLLGLVCTAEIAVLSNYSWKDTVVIIVTDAIFSAKNQNWLWTWSELEGSKEARRIAPISVFSAFPLPTGGNTFNKPVGLAFCVMKTFLKAVMLAKTVSVQLIILSCVGLTNAEVFCLLFSLTKLIF